MVIPKYEKEKVLVSWGPELLTLMRALKHPSVVPVLIHLDHGVVITLAEILAETLEENCRQETTTGMAEKWELKMKQVFLV